MVLAIMMTVLIYTIFGPGCGGRNVISGGYPMLCTNMCLPVYLPSWRGPVVGRDAYSTLRLAEPSLRNPDMSHHICSHVGASYKGVWLY